MSASDLPERSCVRQLGRLEVEVRRDVLDAGHQAGAAKPNPKPKPGPPGPPRPMAEVTARAAEAGAAEDRLRAVLDALLDRVALLLGELAGRHLRVDLILERLLERVAELGRVDPERAGGVVDDRLAARLRRIVLRGGVRRTAADDRDDGERGHDHPELAVGRSSLGGHPALPSHCMAAINPSNQWLSECTRSTFLGPRCEQHRSAIGAECAPESDHGASRPAGSRGGTYRQHHSFVKRNE